MTNQPGISDLLTDLLNSVATASPRPFDIDDVAHYDAFNGLNPAFRREIMCSLVVIPSYPDEPVICFGCDGTAPCYAGEPLVAHTANADGSPSNCGRGWRFFATTFSEDHRIDEIRRVLERGVRPSLYHIGIASRGPSLADRLHLQPRPFSPAWSELHPYREA